MKSTGSNFAVVGSGIIGLNVALELIKEGHGVVIFEKNYPGSGSSLAANGAITPYSDQTILPIVRALAEESILLYPGHIAELKEHSRFTVDYDTEGVLQLVLSGEQQDEVRKSFDLMLKNGWPVDWLDAADAASLEPTISSETIAGIHFNSESRIDIPQLINASVESLRQQGCVFSCPQHVVGITSTESRAVEIETVAGTATFDGIVVATGDTNMYPITGIPKFQVDLIRGEIIETVGPPRMINHCLYRGDAFITPRRDGRMLVGTNYIKHKSNMDITKDTISVKGGRKTLNAASEILPDLDRCEINRVWKGWRPTTKDSLPVIGRLEDTNIVIAIGFGGLGFTLAPAASKLAVQALCKDSNAREIKEFSPHRNSLQASKL